jgi:AAHS family 3-hydroxyphenylpropionic acid transporter
MNSPTFHTRWPLIFILWFCGMGAAMQFAKVSLPIDELQAYYDASLSEMGLVLSWVGVCGMIFAACVSVFINRFGYRQLLFLAMILATVLAWFQVLLPPLPILLATRLVEGVAHLIIVVTAPTLMAAACRAEQRSMIMSLWGTFFGVAFSLLGALSPWLMPMGVDSFFVFHALWMLVMLILLALIFRKDLIATPIPRPHISIQNIIQQHVEIYGQLRTVLPSLCFITYTALYVALLTFFPKVGGTGPEWLRTVLPLVSLAGAFGAGALVQKGLKPTDTTMTAFGSSLVAFLILALAYHQGLELSWFKVAVFFTLGLMQGAIYGMIPYLTVQAAQQAQSISAIAQLGNLGSTIGPPLFGIAFGAWGATGILVLSLLMPFIGLFLIVFFSRKLDN